MYRSLSTPSSDLRSNGSSLCHWQRSWRDRFTRFRLERIAAVLHRFLHDLVLQHRDRVYQHFRPRRTAGIINIDRHDLVNALDDRVIIKYAARCRTRSHRNHPFWFRHLVVDSPEAPEPFFAKRVPRRSSRPPAVATRGTSPLQIWKGRCLDETVFIISIAQHARPKVAGQRLDLRAQFTTASKLHGHHVRKRFK